MALRQINQANNTATQKQQHGEEERTSRRGRSERSNRREEELDDAEAERALQGDGWPAANEANLSVSGAHGSRFNAGAHLQQA